MPSVPNWWQDLPGHIRESAEREASRRSRSTGEDPSIGLWGSMFGANEAGAQEYTQKQVEKTGKAQIHAADPNAVFVPGQTKEQYASQADDLLVSRRQQQEKNSLGGQQVEAQITDLTEGRNQQRIDSQNNFTIAQGTLNQNAKAQNDNMTLMLQKMDQQDRNSRLDRIERNEIRADELMFRREDQMRADRRYEKERRRESIQALVAGLSSLGAAFAV